MTAAQQPAPNHLSETFGSGQTQFFECEALSADHPEIQARERARQQRLQTSNPTEKQARPAPPGQEKRAGKEDAARLTWVCQSSCVLFSCPLDRTDQQWKDSRRFSASMGARASRASALSTVFD